MPVVYTNLPVPEITETLKESTVARCHELFTGGFACAESVLKSVSETLGFDTDLIPRIASGFCGGMARTGGPCGAVTGAMMVFGLVSGRNSTDRTNDWVYEQIQELHKRFKEKYETINCREITGINFLEPDGQQKFWQSGQYERCLALADETVRITLDILNEYR